MDEIGREEMDGKLFLYRDPYWATGGKWWSIENSYMASTIITEEPEGGGFAVRNFGGEHNGSEISAGPFDSVESAYAAWSLMNG